MSGHLRYGVSKVQTQFSQKINVTYTQFIYYNHKVCEQKSYKDQKQYLTNKNI